MQNIAAFGEIEVGTKYQDRPSAYGFVHDRSGSIAVIQTNGRWFLPGGGIEPHESYEEALRRELREEIGAAYQGAREICRCKEYFIGNSGTPYLIHARFYSLTGVSLRDDIRTDFTHEISWVDPQIACERLHRPGQVWALKLALCTE